MARPAIAVVLFTGFAALSRFPHDSFIDRVIFAFILMLTLSGAAALWHLSRRAVDRD